MGIRHTFVSNIPDGPNADEVRPSDWNAEHVADPASETSPGVVQLAPDGGVTPGQVVQANDSRLAGAATTAEKAALEMEMSFKAANASNYKRATYNLQGQLEDLDIWETAAMLVKLFNKHMTYTDGKLTELTVSRISDGATLVRTLSYAVDGAWSNTTTAYTP